MHLRNAPTGAMKQWGYGAGYQHAHKFEDALPDMECLPESLAGTRFYEPTNRGLEQRIAERLEEIRAARKPEFSTIFPESNASAGRPVLPLLGAWYHPKLGRLCYCRPPAPYRNLGVQVRRKELTYWTGAS